jgi:AraC family transcriptional regulator of adaptative response / methylphosphotriester-DNA alkyltransferase methyltransferase
MAAQRPRPRSTAHREATVQLMAELYLRARAIVEQNYRRRLTLPLVARLLAVSPRQLQRAYEEIGLTTFAIHLRSVRLRNAADLLAHQPLTVTDVARLVGYRQPSHFVKAFQRRYGTTPGAYRERAGRRRAGEVRRVRAIAQSPTPPTPSGAVPATRALLESELG